MFTITEADNSAITVQHGGIAITVQTITTVVEPGTVTATRLEDWIKSQATYDEEIGEWSIDSEEIGQFDSMGSDNVEDLIYEVRTYLEERGVTVTD